MKEPPKFLGSLSLLPVMDNNRSHNITDRSQTSQREVSVPGRTATPQRPPLAPDEALWDALDVAAYLKASRS